jgi:predicted Zn-dependent protease with MMP-like domain
LDRAPIHPPTNDMIEALGLAALETIPPELRAYITSVPILVEEFADDETCAEMGLESPFDLLGLYRGVTLRNRDAGGPPSIDTIHLYRRPLLDYWCETGEDLADLIRHVLIHEIGHHFGLSDADMARIEEEG